MRIGHAEMAVKRASEEGEIGSVFCPPTKKAGNVPYPAVCPCLHARPADDSVQMRATREFAADRGWTIVMQSKDAPSHEHQQSYVGFHISSRELLQDDVDFVTTG